MRGQVEQAAGEGQQHGGAGAAHLDEPADVAAPADTEPPADARGRWPADLKDEADGLAPEVERPAAPDAGAAAEAVHGDGGQEAPEPARLPAPGEQFRDAQTLEAPSELPLVFRNLERGAEVAGSDIKPAQQHDEQPRGAQQQEPGTAADGGSASYPDVSKFIVESSGFHMPLPATWALRPDAPLEAYRMTRPTVYHTAMRLPRVSADVEHQEAIREAFLHSWRPYEQYAWGRDTLKPVSKTSDDGFLKMGITIVDSLDTLLIMGLREEFDKAAEWVANQLRFGHQEDINTFETTIRVLGGVLAAWDLDGRRNDALLQKAKTAADALSIAFDSPTGLPYGTLGLGSRRKYNPGWVGGSTISEVATLQLEWEFLSHVTGDPTYATWARRVMAHLQTIEPLADSLYGMYISPDSGMLTSSTITLGARGDSLYEYLLKQYLLAGGTAGPEKVIGNAALREGHTPIASYAPTDASKAGAAWREAILRAHVKEGPQANPYACTDAVLDGCEPDDTGAGAQAPGFPTWKHLYDSESSTETEASFFTSVLGMYYRSVEGIERELVRTSKPSGFVYIAERHDRTFDDKMDHLVCFVPGMLALGSLVAPTQALAEHHMQLAKDIMKTCIHMYEQTATGLAAEITRFPGGGDPIPDPGAKHNLLRPETVESLMVLYRITGEQQYRDAGWKIFSAFNRWSRVPHGGYSTLRDVTVTPPQLNDQQESFWLAETLKYLYLLFSDSDTVPLDEFVFNTEAHPLRVFGREAASRR